jgi:hypothetical protein
LHKKEFVWFIPNDDNRIADAKILREEFFDTVPNWEYDENWEHLYCSMLEMLIALSKRISFIEGRLSSSDWFWIMIENVCFFDCSDEAYENDPSISLRVDEILDRIIWRTYSYNGDGGLFPLRDPPNDQRRVEIWYQMNYFLIEHYQENRGE